MSKLIDNAKEIMLSIKTPNSDTTNEYDLEYAKVCCLISIAESFEILAKKEMEPTK